MLLWFGCEVEGMSWEKTGGSSRWQNHGGFSETGEGEGCVQLWWFGEDGQRGVNPPPPPRFIKRDSWVCLVG